METTIDTTVGNDKQHNSQSKHWDADKNLNLQNRNENGEDTAESLDKTTIPDTTPKLKVGNWIYQKWNQNMQDVPTQSKSISDKDKSL